VHLHHLPQRVHRDDPRQGHHRDAGTPARKHQSQFTDDTYTSMPNKRNHVIAVSNIWFQSFENCDRL
jgi:hypothetical protein